MKIPAFLSKAFQFYKSTLGLSLLERIRILKSNHRISRVSAQGNLDKKISIERLYETVGCIAPSLLEDLDEDARKHIHPEIKYHDSYFRNVQEKIREYGLAEYVSIEKNPKKVYVAEENSDYDTKYKVTVKNLIINVSDNINTDNILPMYLCPLYSTNDTDEETPFGIYLVFENNVFIATDDNIKIVNFVPKDEAYIVFQNNNIFKSVDLLLETSSAYKIELTHNQFINSHVEISFGSFHQDLACLEDNIFYNNDNVSSKLKINSREKTKCYFKGKNSVDNLMISTKGYLHWGGYQNIDPKGKHAYIHKKMFIDFMEHAINKNDKMQETVLRRELLKCERVILREEKTGYSSQDKFILWWSSWISDYGISWFRPLSWLIAIHAILVLIVFYFFECQSSRSLLFFELFNPLSSLSGVADIKNIKGNEWVIAAINIAQKAFLAAAYYEIIKIFRRFSK